MPVIDLENLRWIVPVSFALVLIIQLLYLGVLGRIPTVREPRAPSPVLPPVQDYAPATAYAPPLTAMSTTVAQPAPQPLASYRAPAPQAPEAAPAPQFVTQALPASALVAPRSSASIGKFIVLAGLDNVAEFSLPSRDFGIGRFFSPENDIHIGMDEKSVSRKHARFTADEGVREYYVKDTSSSFGSFLLINGQFEQLSANVQERVYNEDVVRFGNVITVRLLLPCETRGAVTSL